METTLLARDYFKRAIEIDPEFYRAYAGLAQVYGHLAVTTGEYLNGEEMVRTARIAVAGDSKNYLSQTALGIGLMFSRDIPGSLRAHEKAIALNPHNAQSRAWYGQALLSGYAKEAAEQLEIAIRLSPNDPWIGPFYGRLARAYYYADDIQRAVRAAKTSFNHPHHWPVQLIHIACLSRLGRPDDAAKAIVRLLDKHPYVSKAFVQSHLPEWHVPYREALMNDLSQVGLP